MDACIKSESQVKTYFEFLSDMYKSWDQYMEDYQSYQKISITKYGQNYKTEW